jgi:alkaline phosphatase
VILFVGDGMQLAHEVAASRYLTGADAGLAFHDPLAFEWAGFAATWDVTTYDRYAGASSRPAYAERSFDPAVGYDVVRGGALPYPLEATPDDAYFLARIGGKEPATDSASAATALATGWKTDDGNVAWRSGDPPDGALTSIAEDLRARFGAAIGVVSTVPFTHATPACFVAHAPSRASYAAIGAEIVNGVKPDVVIGGGWPGFTTPPSYAYVAAAEYAALRAGATGYTFVERVPGTDGGAALLSAAAGVAAAGGKLFGLFGGSGGNLESPVPTNDGSGVVNPATRENPTLAQAARAALTVLSKDPDGFFVLIEQGDIDWANHAGDFPRMVGTIWDLDAAVREAIAFVDRPDDAVTWENTLLVVTADHANNYLRFGPSPPGRGILPAVDAGGVPTDPAQYTLYPLAGQGSWSHTNELVSVYAKGGSGRDLFRSRAGSWYPGAHVLDNTQIHDAMAEFLGLR